MEIILDRLLLAELENALALLTEPVTPVTLKRDAFVAMQGI
ncbi:hypothetical protein [Jeotgalibaca sp. A122]